MKNKLFKKLIKFKDKIKEKILNRFSEYRELKQEVNNAEHEKVVVGHLVFGPRKTEKRKEKPVSYKDEEYEEALRKTKEMKELRRLLQKMKNQKKKEASDEWRRLEELREEVADKYFWIKGFPLRKSPEAVEEAKRTRRKKALLKEIRDYSSDFGNDEELVNAVNECFKVSRKNRIVAAERVEEVKKQPAVKRESGGTVPEKFAELPETFRAMFENHNFNRMENIVLSLLRGEEFKDNFKFFKQYLCHYSPKYKERIKSMMEAALEKKRIQEDNILKEEIQEILKELQIQRSISKKK